MFDPAWHVWVMVILAVFGFAASVGLVLYRGGLAADLSRRQVRRIGVGGLVVILGWTAVHWALAGSGAYRRSQDSPIPLIVVAIVVAIAGLLWLAGRQPMASALRSSGTLVRLTLPHTLRILGAVFLVAMADGGLPGVFAVLAGVGDMAVGVAAPVVAWQLARGSGARSAVWFNILGLLDLVMALTLGLLSAPGLFNVIDATPSTEAVSAMPLALIPLVAVPTAITFHALSLRRLLGRSSDAGAGSPSPRAAGLESKAG